MRLESGEERSKGLGRRDIWVFLWITFFFPLYCSLFFFFFGGLTIDHTIFRPASALVCFAFAMLRPHWLYLGSRWHLSVSSGAALGHVRLFYYHEMTVTRADKKLSLDPFGAASRFCQSFAGCFEKFWRWSCPCKCFVSPLCIARRLWSIHIFLRFVWLLLVSFGPGDGLAAMSCTLYTYIFLLFSPRLPGWNQSPEAEESAAPGLRQLHVPGVRPQCLQHPW